MSDELLAGPRTPLDLALEVDGQAFRRFTKATVLDSVDAGAVSFRLEVGAPSRPFPFRLGQSVSLRVGDELLVQGHLETIEGTFDVQGGTTVVLEGRSSTGDLVDCSLLDLPSEFRALSLPEVARRLVEPFGVEVVDLISAAGMAERYRLDSPFRVFRPQPGEGCWEALDRLAKLRGVLVHGDPRGRLELTVGGLGGPAAGRVVDRYGRPPSNVLSSRLRLSQSERYSRLVVRGQAPGDDDAWGAEAAHVEGEASDASVLRYRPLLVVAQRPVDLQSARDLAEWEAVVRRARGTSIEATLPRWTTGQRGGGLWRVNTTVEAELATWNLAGTFLVAAVQYLLDESDGYTVQLQLVPPDSLDRLAEIAAEDESLEGLLEGWDPGDADPQPAPGDDLDEGGL